MRNISTANRQFSLRSIFWVMTAAAIVCAGWAFADRWLTEQARDEQLHQAAYRRQRDRSLADWQSHSEPCDWDFGQ